MIADDLTGAADTGAAFVCSGLVVMIALDPDHVPAADVLVVSTESRSLTEEEAIERVAQAARSLANPDGETWIYKKIDSTLRGYPAAELRAIMDALHERRAVVAPAFPAQGRTTISGHQMLSGHAVDGTASGAEVEVADLQQLIASNADGYDIRLVDLAAVRLGPEAMCGQFDGPAEMILIADAETDEDLSAIVRCATHAGVHLLCGSAGLAHALAAELSAASSVAAPTLPDVAGAPVLVVAGSPHPATRRQVDVAQLRGEMIARVDHAFLGLDESIKTVIDAIALGMSAERSVVLTTSGLHDVRDSDQAVADYLGEIVRGLVMDGTLGGLVLTGGDVSAAVCRALGTTAIWLRGEVQPGIPWGLLVGGVAPGLPVVTKSGGFGDADALVVAIDHLTAPR